jgi:hypothetical protein
MLTEIEHGAENPVKTRLEEAGYGPGAKNLTAEHKAMRARVAAARKPLSTPKKP